VLLSEGGVEQLQAKDSNGCLPIHLAATFSSRRTTSASQRTVQALILAGSIVDARARQNALKAQKELVVAPPLSPAELLLANPPSQRPALAAFLAQQARQAGLADQAMRPGTRVQVGELGEGVYERFERCWLGCNHHYIRFATGVESELVLRQQFGSDFTSRICVIELKKLATETWTVLPEPVPADPNLPAAGAAALPAVAQLELEPEAEAAAPAPTATAPPGQTELRGTAWTPIGRGWFQRTGHDGVAYFKQYDTSGAIIRRTREDPRTVADPRHANARVTRAVAAATQPSSASSGASGEV
jgi:hypothetical protein